MELNKMYKNGTQNEYINTLIKYQNPDNTKIENDLIFYNPHIIDANILCTNMILRTLLQDNCAEWHNPKIYKNTFGKIQYWNGNQFPFQKIFEYTEPEVEHTDVKLYSLFQKYTKTTINELKEKNNHKGITNIWIVFENPKNLKLNNIVKNIRLECGGVYIHRFGTPDLENEINILAYIFRCDGIQYKNNKIYVPLIIPYNAFIFFGSYHNADIWIEYHDTIYNISYKIYANIIDKTAFPKIKNTNSFTNKCEFIFYQLQYTGSSEISYNHHKVKIHFGHPTYVMYLMNISREYVKSIKLFLNNYIDYTGNTQTDYYEYTEFTVEWFSNHAIIWLNKDFLMFEKLNENINFSVCANPYLLIENTYPNLQIIELLGIHFNAHLHIRGLTGLKYGL